MQVDVCLVFWGFGVFVGFFAGSFCISQCAVLQMGHEVGSSSASIRCYGHERYLSVFLFDTGQGSRLVEEVEHRMDQDATEQKE